jgi:uncharacterized repeat protein (TIGR03803 family)
MQAERRSAVGIWKISCSNSIKDDAPTLAANSVAPQIDDHSPAVSTTVGLTSGGLIMDRAGDLYGTTYNGGHIACSAPGGGVVFELTPNADRSAWTEKVLYTFRGAAAGCFPRAGLIMDAAGNLYGTTQSGGPASDNGVVFELRPGTTGTEWTETVLHPFFCTRGGSCLHGENLQASLIMDAAGSLYGTTFSGGIGDAGVVFELIKSP